MRSKFNRGHHAKQGGGGGGGGIQIPDDCRLRLLLGEGCTAESAVRPPLLIGGEVQRGHRQQCQDCGEKGIDRVVSGGK
jgi:hypothetical protein